MNDDLVRHFQVDHLVDGHAHLLQSLGLGNRAGHAVQNEAIGAVRLSQTFLDDANDDGIRDKRAFVDKLLSLQPISVPF